MTRLAAMVVAFAVAGCVGSAAPPDAGRGARPVLDAAPVGEVRAILIALHGYNDRKAAFEHLAAAAAARGVRVVAYDQSGFGGNVNAGYWGGAEVMVEDLRRAIGAARAEAPGRPVFVVGESMGASVAMLALAGPDAPPVDGLILAAPAVWAGDALNPLFRSGLRVVAGIAPDLDLASGRPADIQASDNVEMLRDLARDPLYTRTARAAALDGLVRLMDAGLEAAPRLRLPRLVLIGVRDEVVPDHAYDAFLAALDGTDCTLIRYPDGWHLLYRDHQRARAIDDTLDWLLDGDLAAGERCAPQPS